MPDTFRFSPSGPSVNASGGGTVESVFGRQGDVVAVVNDYDTDQVDNDSSVPGATCSDALEELAGSSSRTNQSSVPGATVSDALDYLEANIGPPPRGSLTETFMGGQTTTITAAQTTGNVGDNGWSVRNISNSTGMSVAPIVVAGSVGVLRITSPTGTPTGTPAGPEVYLGKVGSNDEEGPFLFSDFAECTWRARFNPTPGGVESVYSRLGIIGHVGGIGGSACEVGFIVNVSGPLPPTGPNYFTNTFTNPGAINQQNTGVPVDNAFHDFRVVRVSASQIDYYIDDVLVISNTNVLAIPPANTPMRPGASVLPSSSPTPVNTTFLDIDTFSFTPV